MSRPRWGQSLWAVASCCPWGQHSAPGPASPRGSNSPKQAATLCKERRVSAVVGPSVTPCLSPRVLLSSLQLQNRVFVEILSAVQTSACIQRVLIKCSFIRETSGRAPQRSPCSARGPKPGPRHGTRFSGAAVNSRVPPPPCPVPLLPPSPEKKGKWRRTTSKSLPGLNGFAGVGVKRSHFTGSPPARFPVQDAVAPQQRPGSPDGAASGKPAGRDTCPGSASVPAGPRTAGPGAHAGGLRPCRAHSGAVFRLALGDASGPPLGQASREDPVKSQAPLLLGDTAEALGSRRSELSSKALPTFVPSASVRGSPGTAAAGATRVGQLALAGENTMNFRSHTFQNLSLSCL